MPLFSSQITTAMTAATKRKKQSQNQRQVYRRRCCLRCCFASQESLPSCQYVGARMCYARWGVVLVLQLWARGVAAFFVEVHGGGEALPECWVADACHCFCTARFPSGGLMNLVFVLGGSGDCYASPQHTRGGRLREDLVVGSGMRAVIARAGAGLGSQIKYCTARALNE